MPKETDPGDRHVLDGVAVDVMDRFDDGLAHLSRVRTAARALGETVERLLTLTGDQGDDAPDDDPLQNFLSHARIIRDRSGETARLLSEDSFSETLTQMDDDLRLLRDRATELRSVTYLTKIVCADDALENARLDPFIRTLEQRSVELREISTQALKASSAIRGASREAAGTLSSLGTTFDEMVRAAETASTEIGTLAEGHASHIATVRDNSRRLAEDIGGAVSRLIDCLQFPDAFSQRREHVVAIIAARETATGGPERHALGRIAAAQLAAMGEALVQVTQDAQTALSVVTTSVDACAPGGGAGRDDPSAQWLDAARRGNDLMREAADAGRARLDSSLALLDGVLGHIAEAISGLEASVDLNGSLENSARNAAISASRAGDSGSALHVLSQNVREVVIATTALTERLSKALQRVHGVSDGLKGAGLREELAMLDRIQAGAKSMADAQTGMLRKLGTQQAELSQQAADIRQAAQSASTAFGSAGQEAPRLELIAANQEQAIAPDDADAAVDLAWVEALYTMEEERAVHRALYPDSFSSAMGLSVTADEADEDLDGFLM